MFCRGNQQEDKELKSDMEVLARTVQIEKVAERFLENNNKGGSMDFGGAVRALKLGRKVARKDWGGKPSYLWLKKGCDIKSEWCRDPELKKVAERNGGSVEGSPVICAYQWRSVLTGWLPGAQDIFASDWFVYEE